MEWRAPTLCVLALALTCALQVNATKAKNHVNSVCSTWGKDHFKTFDGDVYQFPGMCEYSLASDCHTSFQEFSVHMQRTVVDGNSSVSRVVVTINDLVIDLTKSLAMVNSEVVKLPYHSAGVLVEKSTIYTKLYAKLGLSVMWNRHDAITLELDSKYANRTCGLCGDFNGIQIYDEFIHEGRKISPIEFGNKHKIHNPTVDCEDPYEEEEEPDSMNTCQEFLASCAQLLQSDAWQPCARVLSPAPYIQACAEDKCRGLPGDTQDGSSICATLAEYSRQCSHAGGTPPNWRTPIFCAVQCPFNMVYSESGSPCVDTCTNTDTSLLCEEHKMDGCFCPDGTVFDDISKTGCIAKEQCQCKHDKVYNSGEVLQKDNEECVCHQGMWSCKTLSTPGVCTVEEGSHITTYDGKAYTFHGDCYYVLSKDCASSKFSVLGQLAPCSTQEQDTCLKSVVVSLNKDRRNVLVFRADGKVIHNAEINLPYSTAELTIFRPSSFHVMLQTNFGLQLQIQLVPIMQVYITLDQSYKTKTCGLCGNFNMVLSDDLKTPQGLVEGTAASFGNSWKAQASCPDRAERLDDPCALSMDNENYAEHWCSLLKSKESAFAKCHRAVNPEIYYKRCKYSSCNCEKSEDCLCAVFSSYVRACSAKGVFLLGWRSAVCNKYTGHCPASQTFFYQLQDCQRTCRSLASERQGCSTDFLPVDGCSCPDGLYQDDRGVCVPMAKCPCYHNGEHVKPGKSINIKDEHCVCSNGKLHCKSWKTRSMGCPSPKVFFNCSTAGPDEHGLECAQTCMQLDDDCFPSECESGCQCPSGLLDDGRGHCAKQHDCPCQHDGHFYAAGTQLPVKCNTCTCKRGKWVCTDQKCPSTCSIYGSGHYNTFDEQRFGFNGDCGYVAVQNKCGNKTGDFRVITENVPCGTTGTTCSKSVRIYLGRVELKLSQGSYETLDLGVGPVIKYRVTNVGLYLVIESDIGLAVLWDRKTTVRIILQPQHKGEVCGLCGNFNGDGSDDFTTQGQLRVSSILEFANSWKVSSHCPDAEEDFDPCSARPNRHTWAQMQCSIIKGDTFKACHNKVDLQPYLDNCVKDSCACDSGGDCECFCTAVAAYAQACNEVGVCVAWRTPEICPVFCDYYNAPFECKWHYLPCHTPCYKTCLNPQGICSNPLPNLEGCYPICPEDKPIFDEESQTCVDICVPTTPTTTPTTTTTPTPTPEQSTTTKPVGTPTPPGTSTPPTPTTTPTTTTTTTPTTTPTPEQSTTTVVITSATPTPTTVTSSPTTVVTHSTTTPGKTPPPGSSTPSISITTPTITTTTKTTTATTTPTPEQSTTTAFTVATEPPHTIITSPQVIITTPATSSSITHFTTTTGETTPPGTSTPSTPTTTPTTTTTTPTTTPTPEQSTTTVVITSATPTPTTVTSSPTTVVTHSTTTTGKTPPPGSSTPSISITTPTITTTTKTTTATTTPTPEQSTTTAFTVATEPPHTIITSPQVIITTPATSSSITHFTTTTGETTPPGTSTPSTPTTTPTTTTTTPTTTPTPERSTTTVVITSSTPTPTTVTSSPTTVVTHSTTTTGETPTPPGTSTPSTPTTTPTTTTTTTPTPEQSTTTVVITSATPTPTTVTSSPTTVVTHSTTTTGQTPPPVPSTPSTPKTTPTTTPTTTTATTTTPVQSTTTETTRPTTVTASPTTVVTHSTTTPGESPTPPPHPECPEWDVAQNETFLLCNCTMARCIENNTIEIIPYECPPLENITCANGKKPVLVYDEYYCCQHYACDCYCEGWGDPHYITFDGLFYSFQGNCTYVLMEEIRPRYNFKIYIDNVHCDPREDVSCPRAIIVSYNSLVITLKNHNLIGAAKLEAIMDNNPLRLPFSRNGVKVINSGINMIVEIPTLGIVVSFGITGFSVNLPFKHFGNNTEGHCGTCNNNKADDCMLPNGQLVDSCAVMAEYWPAKDLYRPDCPVPQVLPTSSPVQPTEKPCTPNSVCNLIMGSPFDDCHRFVSPDPFFYGCVFDSCHMINPTVECTSLQTYAAACAQFGVCLYWRNHTTMCNSECPADKVYKPCGPVEQPTCDDNPDEPTMGLVTEGCFCPDGMKLFNKDSGVCVETCGCLDPEGVPREFGETFEYKCQDCTCMMDTKVVICKPKVCSNPGTVTCNEPGFIMVNETDPSDPCCSKLSCRCDSSTCPSIDMTCNVGYKPVVSVPEGKCCAEHTCEPKKVCVHKNMEYEPGTSIPVVACQECHCTLEVDPKTQLYKIQCEVVSCDEVCETGYMKLEANDECCAKCVQTHCAIQLNGTTQLLEHGSSWSPPGQKCMKYSCTLIGGSYVTTESNIQCPPFNESNCQTDTIQTASDGCCRVCIEKERACKVETKKRLITINGCQTHNEVEMPYCEGACNTFSKYSELAASMQHSCACCQETRSSNRTVSLRCLNGDFVDYTYTYVEECGCSQTDCQQTHMAKPGRRTRSIRLP